MRGHIRGHSGSHFSMRLAQIMHFPALFDRAHPTNKRTGRESGPFFFTAMSAEHQPWIGTRVISTRRFCARPDSVSLLATGRVSPAPDTIMRLLATPRLPR